MQATLTHDLRNVDSDFPTLTDENLTDILLYGNQTYDKKTNQMILMQVIQYIILKIHKKLMNLFLIRPKLLLTSYTFDSISHFNTYKM